MLRAVRAVSSGGKGGVKGLLSGAIVVLSLALLMLVPVIGACLCPANVRSGTGNCCPSPGGVDAALSKDDCCVAPAPQPASAAEAAGTLRAPFVAITMALAVGHGDVRIIAPSPPQGPPLPAAARPLLNLRI